MEDEQIEVRGVEYTLRYIRMSRGRPTFHVFLGAEQISDSPLTKDDAISAAQAHYIEHHKLPRRKSPRNRNPIHEIRNSVDNRSPKTDNCTRDIDQMDAFLQFTACDFDVSDLGIL